jgi:hypothetical protein
LLLTVNVCCLHYAVHCAASFLLQYAISFEVASLLSQDKGNCSGGMGCSGEGKSVGGWSGLDVNKGGELWWLVEISGKIWVLNVRILFC